MDHIKLTFYQLQTKLEGKHTLCDEGLVLYYPKQIHCANFLHFYDVLKQGIVYIFALQRATTFFFFFAYQCYLTEISWCIFFYPKLLG